MRLANVALAALVSGTALAGGSTGSNNGGAVFRRGQVWLLQTLTADLARGEQRLDLNKTPNTPPEIRPVNFNLGDAFLKYDAASQQAAVFLLGDGKITQFCLMKAAADGSFSGLLLTGTEEQVTPKYADLKLTLESRRVGNDLWTAAKQAGYGTCTLKRLR